jgi:hypothetical protein
VKKITVILVFVGVMSGCTSNAPNAPPNPSIPLTVEQRCASDLKYLGNPYVTPAQAAVVIEIMRNLGCMSGPRPIPDR